MSSENDLPSAQDQTSSDPEASPAARAGVDRRVSEIATLLASLEDVAAQSGQTVRQEPIEHEGRLVKARLGVAAGLYAALRCKHAPTALHGLRVSLGCSSWALALEVPEAYRDALEIAALLHDVGKIGVPEHILLKPGKLQPDEVTMMGRHRQMSVDILGASCTHADVTEILRYAPAWFDGSRHGFDRQGTDLPLGSRMLAVVDAFDAMTTDHVYRPARSRERAVAELFEFAGSQFDPDLVKHFAELLLKDPQALTQRVSQRWLTELAEADSEESWGGVGWSPSSTSSSYTSNPAIFESRLIDTMHDGVVFVDGQLQVFVWNTGTERMTGVAAQAARGRVWTPDLLEMRDVGGRKIADDDCPVARAIRSGVQSIQRMSIQGRQGKEIAIDLHAVPVCASDGAVHGASILLHDASPEASLEERCQALHDQATKDPLTQVANRAEFDRMHALFIEAHLESGLPCSLIITDIDHFKFINDNFGHQAGDEVLVSFAGLLKRMCRAGDLVARYGGEEFVVLCADCNNAAAARRAEHMRKKLAELSHASLSNRNITASFGATELQPGDTPETMLRRSDRALLQAKDQGRNQVVQLGDGMGEAKAKRSWWPFGAARGAFTDCHLVTVVPIEIAIQKLRGFIADHTAKISSTGDDHLHLEIAGENAGMFRRRDDRPVPFEIELTFQEEQVERSNAQGHARGKYVQTRIHVIIRPRRDRDRRREEAADRARCVLASLKSYLMARDETEVRDPPTPVSASHEEA